MRGWRGWRAGGLEGGWAEKLVGQLEGWAGGLEGWRAGGLEARRAGRSTISELAQNS